MVATLRFILVLAIASMAVGCVSEQISPDYKPKMGVAQNADGSIVFALQTRVEYEYSIYFEDPRSGEWKVIPGCERIRGTGETIEIRKNFNASGPLPAFTVRHTKIR